MFYQLNRRRKAKEDAEKPFWISYSDLMTACMTLFLVVMAVEIVSLEKQFGTQEAKVRNELIQTCYEELSTEAKKLFPIVNLEYAKSESISIDLGAIVNFVKRDFRISSEGVDFLRTYVPSVVHSLKSPACSKYIRRIIVEGYTDTDGNYLPNLSLSQRRSAEVVCSLSNEIKSSIQMSSDDLNSIRDLFLVGGFPLTPTNPRKLKIDELFLSWNFGNSMKKKNLIVWLNIKSISLIRILVSVHNTRPTEYGLVCYA